MTKAHRVVAVKKVPIPKVHHRVIKRLEREAYVACINYDPKKPETLEECIVKSIDWAKAGGVQDDSY